MTPRWPAPPLTNRDDLGPLDSSRLCARRMALTHPPVIIARHKRRPAAFALTLPRPSPAPVSARPASSGLYAAWAPNRISPRRKAAAADGDPLYSVEHGVAIKEKESSRRPALSVTLRARPVPWPPSSRRTPSSLCTHRPRAPIVMEVWASTCGRDRPPISCRRRPYLEPGDALVPQVTEGENPRIVSVSGYARP